MAMSEFWFNALQSYAAFALLFGAAVLMIDFLADKLGIGGPRFPPVMFVPAMLLWPATLGVLIAAIAFLINSRK
jgi:hypothetical protein